MSQTLAVGILKDIFRKKKMNWALIPSDNASAPIRHPVITYA